MGWNQAKKKLLEIQATHSLLADTIHASFEKKHPLVLGKLETPSVSELSTENL